MPYFPRQEEVGPYTCRGCGGSFYRSNVSCCVAHPPGTCCHFGEVPAGERRAMADKRHAANVAAIAENIAQQLVDGIDERIIAEWTEPR